MVILDFRGQVLRVRSGTGAAEGMPAVTFDLKLMAPYDLVIGQLPGGVAQMVRAWDS
jgi:hypothetical protein